MSNISHVAVSEAPEARSELAGVPSVSEAGIPPSSEGDKESRQFTPVFVLVDLAAYGFAELGGDRRGHRSRARDRAVVDRVHRADLGRGSAHEHLLRDVEVATGQVVDAHLETVVACDRH